MQADFMRPRILTLITTHQCTAACDHCCFACSPKVTDRIPKDRISKLIDEACEIPSISFISFVGGECFLLGTELDEHIAHASRNGFAVGTTTNAYWATNLRAAHSRVRAVAASGLSTMVISTGEMHAKYVPVERVVSAAFAACEAGLETSVSIETFDGSSFEPKAITEHPQLRDLIAQERLDVFEHDWISNADDIGVRKLRHSPERSRFSTVAEHEGCSIVLDDLTVTPKLRLVACCGYPVESIPELSLGSLETKTLREAIDEAPNDSLALWLHVAGPERMLLSVKREIPDYQLPIEAVHPCQVCLHLHRDPVAMKALKEDLPTYADSLMKAYAVISKKRLAARAVAR